MTDEEALQCFEDDCWRCRQRKSCERLEKSGGSPCRNINAISALRDRIARQNPQPLTGWISVGDRLPETSGEYQCYCNGKSRIAKFKADKSGMCYWDIISNECYSALWRVTHWMPLPEPPEIEETED